MYPALYSTRTSLHTTRAGAAYDASKRCIHDVAPVHRSAEQAKRPAAAGRRSLAELSRRNGSIADPGEANRMDRVMRQGLSTEPTVVRGLARRLARRVAPGPWLYPSLRSDRTFPTHVTPSRWRFDKRWSIRPAGLRGSRARARAGCPTEAHWYRPTTGRTSTVKWQVDRRAAVSTGMARRSEAWSLASAVLRACQHRPDDRMSAPSCEWFASRLGRHSPMPLTKNTQPTGKPSPRPITISRSPLASRSGNADSDA
jgi:hypothetical protein